MERLRRSAALVSAALDALDPLGMDDIVRRWVGLRERDTEANQMKYRAGIDIGGNFTISS